MASQHPDIEKVLFTQEDIDGIVSRLGEQITRDYAGKDLVLIAVLRGAVVFMGDLMRKIELPTNIDFMAVSSYGDGVKSSGIVRIIKDLDIDIRGRDVLIVEDILDSGLTLKYLMKNLESRKPASLEVAAFLWKDVEDRVSAITPTRHPSACVPFWISPTAGSSPWRSTTPASPSPMPLWWATASTMPSAIATFRIWAF